MKKIFSYFKFGIWDIVRYSIILLLVFWLASIFKVISIAVFANIWFWIVAAIVLVAVSWISDSNLSEEKKAGVVFLIVILILAAYMSSRDNVSENSSYLQETCPDCDKF